MLGNLFLLTVLLQSGAWKIHMISHEIGEETYKLSQSSGGTQATAEFEYSDRGNKRPQSLAMTLDPEGRPVTLEIKGRQTESWNAPPSAPKQYFAAIGITPFTQQMLMMRYWASHGRPKDLAILPDHPARIAHIARTGTDSITLPGKKISLERYTVRGLAFGSEVLWLDAQGGLAAAMTFASGLPMEAIRPDLEPAFDELFRRGVAQQLATLAELGRDVPPTKTGAYAITGATLFKGNGEAPIPNSAVVIRAGRIVAAGPRAGVAIPQGMRIVDGTGRMLLPGLWEMHTHYSGVEFGPPTLAAGITTARDCGGEFDLLVAMRDAIEKKNALGPRLLLAGLVDGGGLDAFGAINAATPAEARAVVAKYHAAGFQQIKLYTVLKPDVIKILTDEAHKAGMSVTGHVPRALDTVQGIEAGMDQINHLNYVSRMPRTQETIDFLLKHHTVVDPTVSWSEMGGHSKDIDPTTFEPGLKLAPDYLAFKFASMGSANPNSRMKDNLSLIGTLQKAGVPIVAGSDTGLVGYGLLRELELYVAAGMTSAEAIASATIVPARAMGLDRDTGTIEPGKRADLILVPGNPLGNISDLRKVSTVIANGRMFDTAKLWQSIGFRAN
jgi:imidazolonepropionase-like amidohydrolase